MYDVYIPHSSWPSRYYKNYQNALHFYPVQQANKKLQWRESINQGELITRSCTTNAWGSLVCDTNVLNLDIKRSICGVPPATDKCLLTPGWRAHSSRLSLWQLRASACHLSTLGMYMVGRAGMSHFGQDQIRSASSWAARLLFYSWWYDQSNKMWCLSMWAAVHCSFYSELN